jgi:holo-[acyl-carrier protein] synthase
MLGCGIDLVEVARVRSAIEKNGDHFVRRVYTAEEIAYCSSRAIPWPHWAARFAAKEAFYKALPPGTLAALVWAEIGVAHTGAQGAPCIQLSGETHRSSPAGASRSACRTGANWRSPRFWPRHPAARRSAETRFRPEFS